MDDATGGVSPVYVSLGTMTQEYVSCRIGATNYLTTGTGGDGGQIAEENDLMEVASSSVTSKTVKSLVICNRERTLLVRLSNFSSPPWLRMLVNALTSSPRPELSI